MTKKTEQKAPAENQGTVQEPIWEAALDGDWDTVKELLQHDPSLISVTAVYCCYKMSLLHLALVPVYGKPDLGLIEYLVSMGADVNAQFEVSEDERSRPKDYIHPTPPPLHFSLSSIDVLKFLISQGADVNARDQDGNTVLHAAAKNGFNTEMQERFEYFFSLGADVNARNEKGDTPLHVAKACNRDADMRLKYLIAKGADVHAKNNSGMSFQDSVDDLEIQIANLEDEIATLKDELCMLREAMGQE